jgi:glycosyltransferase involved in cell wall biosynthesis
VEIHVASIASRLARDGFTVEVITQTRGRHTSVGEVGGVTVRRFPVAAPLKRGLSPALCRYLARHRGEWDLVHAHDYHALPAAATLLCRAPLVLTPHYHGLGHSPASRLRNAIYWPLGSQVVRSAARVICVSHAEAVLLRRHFPLASPVIRVIPNGVARDRHAAGAGRRDWGIIYLGRLERYKNVDTVIDAVAELPQEVRLLVIGDGPSGSKLQFRAGSKGLSDRVRFLGRVSDETLGRILSRSRALVTMSSREAFGIGALEALAAGMAVVASDIPAHRELRDRYRERIELVPLRATPGELAQIIERALDAAPFEPPQDLPTWDEAAQLTRAVYAEITEGSP